MEMAN